MREQTKIGEFKSKVLDMVENNIKPQESGNRMDARFVELSNEDTIFRFDAIEDSFCFGIKPYTDLELAKMKHRSDEIRTGSYVTISKFQMGIGTGSCGPSTLPTHSYLANKQYKLKFLISWKNKD